MKKLVTALIIVLPLILLVAIFAVTSIARLSANIHATGIEISNKGDGGVFTFDIFSNRSPMEEWELGVEVQPLVASDRSYFLTVTDAESGEPTDIVTLEDGCFILHDIGVAKLTYTSTDGGYTDSVLFNVITSGVLDFTPTVTDFGGGEYPLQAGTDTDYSVTLPSGSYRLGANFYPASILSADTTYNSSNSNIVNINSVSGRFDAILGGTAIVSIKVGNVTPKTLAIVVTPAADVTVNGIDAASHPTLTQGINLREFSFLLESKDAVSTDDITLTGGNIASSQAALISPDGETPMSDIGNIFRVLVTLSETVKSESSYDCILKVGAESYAIKVAFSNYRFDIYSAFNADGGDELYMIAGETMRLSVESDPINPALRYNWSLESSDVAQLIEQKDNYVELKALAQGEVTLTLDWSVGEGEDRLEGQIVRRLIAVNGVSSILFKEAASTYGLGELAIASRSYNGDSISDNIYTTGFSVYAKEGLPSAALTDFVFSVSEPSLAEIFTDSVGVRLRVKGNGRVTIRATWKYADRFNINSASFSFDAVDGVEVDSYKQLTDAMDKKLAVVLKSDIYLGENLFVNNADGSRMQKYSDGEMVQKLSDFTHELPTTWDYTYYKNLGRDKPSVRYCLEFTNDVYGNGHFINAEYITNMMYTASTLYSFAIFKGPLDFVAASQQGSSVASVKGQDNIVFLNRTDGLTLNNVVLKGCDDASAYDMDESGEMKLNLNLLNYTGTTLEVMADTTVQNSRIMNGRTCVRAFGRDNIDSSSPVDIEAERMNLDISGSIVETAREFLLKVGTNRFKTGDKDVPSPSLYDGDGKEYDAYNSPNCDNYINDAYFVNNYLLTEVIVTDSVFRTSGLFSIGMESHFAGDWLAGVPNNYFEFEGWTGLAATSYPALLRLKGDVVLDDWKKVSSVDSSSLIETNKSIALLSLNIAAMIDAVRNFGDPEHDGEAYKKLVAERDGEQYVHGGIAFYGGGKNYHMLDLSELNNNALKQFNINLSILTNVTTDPVLPMQGSLLPMAAGKQDFRFVLLDSDSFI